jgi:hypothetical protein
LSGATTTSGAKILLAYHYGTFEAPEKGGTWEKALDSDPDESLPFVEAVQARFAVLDPGQILRLPLGALSTVKRHLVPLCGCGHNGCLKVATGER